VFFWDDCFAFFFPEVIFHFIFALVLNLFRIFADPPCQEQYDNTSCVDNVFFYLLFNHLFSFAYGIPMMGLGSAFQKQQKLDVPPMNNQSVIFMTDASVSMPMRPAAVEV
jgi:hypothetical protein